jgi:ribosomal protein S24E
MQLKIIQEKENPLLNRKEIKILIESKITPSYKETRKILSENFKINKDNIKINSIKGKYGLSEFIVNINLYKTKEDKESIEIKSKKEIEAEKFEDIDNKKENKEESKIEENKEESKIEENKEESKIEENKEESKIEENKEESKIEENKEESKIEENK